MPTLVFADWGGHCPSLSRLEICSAALQDCDDDDRQHTEYGTSQLLLRVSTVFGKLRVILFTVGKKNMTRSLPNTMLTLRRSWLVPYYVKNNNLAMQCECTFCSSMMYLQLRIYYLLHFYQNLQPTLSFSLSLLQAFSLLLVLNRCTKSLVLSFC